MGRRAAAQRRLAAGHLAWGIVDVSLGRVAVMIEAPPWSNRPVAEITIGVQAAAGRFDHGGASIMTATRPRETSTIPQARWPAARRRCAAARRPMRPAPARRLGSGRTE